MSVRYGRLVNATSPYDDAAAPPVSVVSPFQSCHAHHVAVTVLKPSGCVPDGETVTYCAWRLLLAVVLPTWPAPVTASAASWWPDAWLGGPMLSSPHRPASAPPGGPAACGAPAG